MGKHAFPLVVALLLAGCASQSPAESETKALASPAATATSAAPAAGGARNETVSNELYEFSYSYPAEAGNIAGLRAVLDADLAKRRAELATWAREGKQASLENSFPFNGYDFGKGWEVVADLPAWLSLSAGFSTYTGGAHPNHGFDALLWDKRAGKLREPLELFRSDRAFVDALRADFCAALNKERAERRGGETTGIFDECIEPTEAVIIFGSSNGQKFDRIGFLIAPYIAGPYAEGDYEVTLPVTAAILAGVKPQYRESFAAAN